MTINDIKHPKIKAWVEECVAMCEPDEVYVCEHMIIMSGPAILGAVERWLWLLRFWERQSVHSQTLYKTALPGRAVLFLFYFITFQH